MCTFQIIVYLYIIDFVIFQCPCGAARACANPDEACNYGTNEGMQINRDWLPIAKVKAGGSSGKLKIYVGSLICGPKQFGKLRTCDCFKSL